MAAKLTRLTHKITQLHSVAESCTICTSRSGRPVRKRLDAPSIYMEESKLKLVMSIVCLRVGEPAFEVLPLCFHFKPWQDCPNNSLFVVREFWPARKEVQFLTRTWQAARCNSSSLELKVKVKLSLCLTKYHAMKTYWESAGIAPLILWSWH
jgi:hypothetical protein